jgi:hypothetical protein
MSAGARVTPDLAALPRYRHLERRFLIVGVAGTLLCVLGLLIPATRAQFLRSWLVGFMLWLGVTLGCMALLMLQHLSGGNWGMAIRRITEAASRQLLFMAAIFLPIAIGVRALYPWGNPQVVAHDDHLKEMARYYLAPHWFIIRAILYFVIWGLLAYALNKWSHVQDHAPPRDLHVRFNRLGGIGLVLYAFTISFASVDWVMSLDPHWYSTIYGLLFMAGQGVSGLAFCVVLLVLLSRTTVMGQLIRKDQFHDIGKLMLAFVMLWAYMSFSQWLIIWSGNIVEEITWYLDRIRGGWGWVPIVLALFHFGVPFALLLSRDLKRDARRLVWVALALLFMRWLDLLWLIEPNFHKAHFHISWLDFAAPIGIGGLWLTLFFRQLSRYPLLPLYDPHVRGFIEQGEDHHG